MLLLGAQGVLATLLPIDAVYSSNFIADLLDFVLHLSGRSLSHSFRFSWAEIVTFIQRRSYLQECNLALSAVVQNSYTPVKIHPADSELDEVIQGGGNWWERGSQQIVRKLKIDNRTFQELLSRHFLHTECLNFIQVGHAERLFVMSELYEKAHGGFRTAEK
jgi:hypothetical protein